MSLYSDNVEQLQRLLGRRLTPTEANHCLVCDAPRAVHSWDSGDPRAAAHSWSDEEHGFEPGGGS